MLKEAAVLQKWRACSLLRVVYSSEGREGCKVPCLQAQEWSPHSPLCPLCWWYLATSQCKGHCVLCFKSVHL